MKATSIIPAAPAASHRPLHHEPLTPNWRGGKTTNREAREVVGKLRRWARQFDHPDARNLVSALDDVEMLFVAVWTEIDESLTRLSLMKEDPAHAAEHLQVAMKYLHRWQDRGGRIGNIEYPEDRRHV
jgi:hypothetical protein